MTQLVKETQNLIKELPQDKLQIVKVFIQWLVKEEELTNEEKKIIAQSRKEIKNGDCVDWRDFAAQEIQSNTF